MRENPQFFVDNKNPSRDDVCNEFLRLSDSSKPVPAHNDQNATLKIFERAPITSRETSVPDTKSMAREKVQQYIDGVDSGLADHKTTNEAQLRFSDEAGHIGLDNNDEFVTADEQQEGTESEANMEWGDEENFVDERDKCVLMFDCEITG